MNCIKKLSADQAQKIAAGEVVERPANIVKELIENSVDAGATAITIIIEDAGKNLIQVIDNGSGMSESDALMCFEHHATSKITSVNDLQTLSTFGFRGEALSSISSVSRCTLRTRMSDTIEGTHVTITHDRKQATPTACPVGTDIAIADLFYNVPARKKFLKSTETEWRAIMQLVHAFCFDYRHIHFKLSHNGNELLNCPPVETISARIAQLWDAGTARHMITIQAEHKQKNIEITGMISDHQYTKYDRSTIYFLVNKRWVKNYSLSKAFLKGYAHVLQPGKYPAGCIFITVNSADIDINVHPRKEEVKFLHPQSVENLLTQAVKDALEKNLSAQLQTQVTFKDTQERSFTSGLSRPFSLPTQAPFADLPARFNTPTLERAAYSPSLPFHDSSPKQHSESWQNSPSPSTIISEFDTQAKEVIQQTIAESEEVESDSPYHILGQYRKTYILLEHKEGLYLVDQHAAHERVLYELFSKRFDQVATVRLLFPPVISISTADFELLEPYLPLLNQNGIEIERWGAHELMIQSAPVHCKDAPLDDLIATFIGWIKEEGHADTQAITKSLNEKLHAQMACKAAVKAGDTLTMSQMHQLLHDLDKHEHRFACPHGRPTGWLLPLAEIEKKFKRRT